MGKTSVSLGRRTSARLTALGLAGAIAMAVVTLTSGSAQAQPAQKKATPASIQPLSRAKSWGYQLRGIDPAKIALSSYDVVVIDFAQENRPFTVAEVETMRTKPDGGHRHVLAYLSIGEAERYRYYWQPSWYLAPPAWIGPENPEWRGNYLVRFWDPAWQKLIFGAPDAYLDRIMAAGFDGIFLDRVDAYPEWEQELPDAQPRMVALVGAVSKYAKQRNDGFQIVVQNAEELLADAAYLRVIDAVAKEDLLHGIRHNDDKNSAEEVAHSAGLLQRARKAGKGVLVVEYLCKPDLIAAAEKRLRQDMGFVPYFARRTLHGLGLAEEDYCKPAGPLGTRVALVVGNSGYRAVPPVASPAAGAKLMAQTLRRVGFTDVRERIDMGLDSLNHELQRFAEAANRADWAVLYYAGLGLHFNGVNFILPVNARIEQPADIARQGIPMEDVLRALGDAAKVRLVFLDACRTNPFLEPMQRRGMSQAAGPGIAARPVPPPATIGYASRCETPIAVKEGEPDAYTAALIRHIPTADLELPWLMERVRDSVLRGSKGMQEPVHFGPMPDAQMFAPAPIAGAK
jgi:cysteinyl-tRNA synthetase, unknown class